LDNIYLDGSAHLGSFDRFQFLWGNLLIWLIHSGVNQHVTYSRRLLSQNGKQICRGGIVVERIHRPIDQEAIYKRSPNPNWGHFSVNESIIVSETLREQISVRTGFVGPGANVG
jgi:hypothetical protein